MYRKFYLLLSVFFIWISFNHSNAELDVEGTNVCFKNKKTNQTVQVKYTYPVNISTYKPCLKFPFTCKNTRTEYRIGLKSENKTVINKIAICCEGYIQDGDKCKPYCPDSCVHGECSSPGVCDCQLGTGGPSCNITCPATKFGLNCEYDCNCLTNPHCNRNYADCSCKPGEITDTCKQICKCKMSVCSPGLIGKKCDLPCPAYTFGSMCIGKCLCKEENTLECSKLNGDCMCKPNFYGIYCEYECKNGKLVCESPNSCKCVIDLKPVDDNSVSDNTLSLKRENSIDESKNNNQGLIFSLIGLLIATISVSMLFLYKYKLKTKKLKKDLHNVTIRYQNGSNDEFVNPLYSYAGGSSNLNPIATYTNGSIATSYATSYAPSSIQTTTLPHPPKLPNQLNNLTSLTTPRKPKQQQNGYLNELSLLPNELFKQKNDLADETNPNIMLKKNQKQTLNSNIYSTIEEVKNYRAELEDNFKDDNFSDNFDDKFDFKFRDDYDKNEKPFKIPEDNDSVDLAFAQVTKRNEIKENGQFDPMHYDQPKSNSPVLNNQSTIDSMYQTPLPLSNENKINSSQSNKQIETESNTSHYDVLNSNNRTYYEQLKK